MEVYYYYLCLYIISICGQNGDIASIVNFVDAYVSGKKGVVRAVPFDQMSKELIIELNEDLLNSFPLDSRQSFIRIQRAIESFSFVNGEDFNQLIGRNYQNSLLQFLSDGLISIHDKGLDSIQLSEKLFATVNEFKDRRNNLSHVATSIIDDKGISLLLESINDFVLDSLMKVYNRDSKQVIIQNDIKSLFYDNLISHVWMTSSWVSSFFFATT